MVKKAVVLCSGGLDSTTVLAMAKEQGFACYGLSFRYGQRNSAELAAARKITAKMGVVKHLLFDLPFIAQQSQGGSALVDSGIAMPAYEDREDSIPLTYVPARNTIFLSIALGLAESLGAYDMFYGASSVDYSGYSDCRPEYVAAFQQMANLATKCGVEGQTITLHSPLVYLSKAQTIKHGLRLGVDYRDTISCYQADDNGAACGYCESCGYRRRGFEQAGVADPTLYQEVIA